jgi:hypothetical protein
MNDKTIRNDVKKVINLIKRGWAKNCLFRNKANKEIEIGTGTLFNLVHDVRAMSAVEKNKKNICKCCLEGAVYLASKKPLEVQAYLKDKLEEFGITRYEEGLASFNDSCSDKRQVLRFLEKTV